MEAQSYFCEVLHKNYRHSFKNAFQGMLTFYKLESNAKIHLILAACALIISAFSNLNGLEWVLIVLAISVVFISEMFNTAIEQLCDFISTEKHNSIKIIKDISAAAVLIASIFAVLTASIILIPKWI
jgi:diacylglycerol kinase